MGEGILGKVRERGGLRASRGELGAGEGRSYECGRGVQEEGVESVS